MIPPWVRPESPETIRWIDDATQAFPPAFGRGTTQRGIWADPRWGLRRRYRGLRSDEKAAILNALNDSRGQFNILRVTPHAPLRGSMPTGELLTNNTFASGTTGWTAGSEYSIAVQDRHLRAQRSANTGPSTVVANSSGLSVVQYAPYAMRVMTRSGRGPCGSYVFAGQSATNSEYGASSSSGIDALQTLAFIPYSASSLFVGITDLVGGPMLAGDYFTIPYTSLARCALADNSPNLLLRSDEFGNASWTKNETVVTSDAGPAPDDTSADVLTETATLESHHIRQSVTYGAAAADYAFTVIVQDGSRSWVYLQLNEATGSSAVLSTFNLATGALGSTTITGANWANLRRFITSLGDDYYACTIVARKTNAATSGTALIGLSNADSNAGYTGTVGFGVSIWRAGVAASSVPVRLAQTTSDASAGTSQSGSALYTKGWPESTSGLLLTGDWVEINGELKQITAPVNSDAAGLAYMQFRPALGTSPADNDPIIIHEPFGRFIYPQGTRELENLFGIYGDCEMNLEEIYV